MYCQVDPDLLVFLSRAVTVPLYYLNTRLDPIQYAGSSLGSCLKTPRAEGLKQKILVLLPRAAFVLGAICKPTQAAMARLPGFPSVYYLCNSLETETCGIQEGDRVCHHTVATNTSLLLCMHLPCLQSLDRLLNL